MELKKGGHLTMHCLDGRMDLHNLLKNKNSSAYGKGADAYNKGWEVQ